MFTWTISLKKERSPAWYSAAAIAGLSLIVWGFLQAIYVLPIVVIIFMGVFLLIENNSPEHAEVSVNENGVGVGTEFYDYATVESFAIVYEGGKPLMLRLRMNRRGIKSIDIDLPQGADNVADLRAFLSGYVTEAKDTELSTLERLTRMLGL